MKKERGITLIALIITIIIMLILVGVTISITLGENGIIEKSKEARVAQEASQDKEASVLAGQGIEGKIDALVSGTGTQTISTRVTSSDSQVYAINLEGWDLDFPVDVIYTTGDVFYLYYLDNWYYDARFWAQELGSEMAEDIEEILNIDNIPADTPLYSIFNVLQVMKLNGSWYTYDYVNEELVLFEFELVDFDASAFEGAIDVRETT